MYCTTLKRYVFFERRIFHISGKEKRPSSYLQVEVKISRKRVVLRSKYVTRWKSREIGWGSRILSRARILKGPSEFLKTRVIDPLTYGAKKKKRKSILGLETRQDWVFSRERRKEKSTNSSIRSREYRSVVEFDERSCSTNREYPLLFSRYSFTRPFFPKKSIRHQRCTYVTASFVIRTQRKITFSSFLDFSTHLFIAVLNLILNHDS